MARALQGLDQTLAGDILGLCARVGYGEYAYA